MSSRFRNRRRTERQQTQWIAEYRTADVPWSPCVAVDVSYACAALDVFGDKLWAGEDIELKLYVNDDDPIGTLLRARVTYAQPTSEGRYRAGIEFEPLAPVNRIRLDLLLEREAAPPL